MAKSNQSPFFLQVALVFLFTFFSQTTLAQGIRFLNTDFTNLLATARQQKKLAFVEVYLTGCPHCEALDPVLMEKKVGDYFNSRFVSMKLEANSPSSKALQEKKQLHYPQFPLLFFFDSEGNLLHQATPADKPTRAEFIDEVIRHASDALTPATRTSGYAARYAGGERGLDFLINLANHAKTTRDTTLLLSVTNDFGGLFVQPADLESPAAFYILSRFIDDFRHPMARYFFEHLDAFRTRHGAKEVQQAGENILFQSLYGRPTNSLNSADVKAIRARMESLGTPAPVAAMRTILKELEAYFREDNAATATARFDDYRRTAALSLQDYAYLMRFFNEKSPDSSYAPSLINWVNDVLKSIKPGDQNKAEVAELYREQSEAYRRAEKKAEGKAAAEKALALARASKEKLDSYVRQLEKF